MNPEYIRHDMHVVLKSQLDIRWTSLIFAVPLNEGSSLLDKNLSKIKIVYIYIYCIKVIFFLVLLPTLQSLVI